jgi:hypothetical protein
MRRVPVDVSAMVKCCARAPPIREDIFRAKALFWLTPRIVPVVLSIKYTFRTALLDF